MRRLSACLIALLLGQPTQGADFRELNFKLFKAASDGDVAR